jgi:putative ABC transport system permease protein
VEQRTHEIGIRAALGAGKVNVLRLVLGDAMKLALSGAAIGIACSIPLPRALRSMFEISHIEGGWIYAGVPVLMATITLLACYVPARRAMRMDPIVTLATSRATSAENLRSSQIETSGFRRTRT